MYKNKERKMEQGQLFPAEQSRVEQNKWNPNTGTFESPRCIRCHETYEPTKEYNTNELLGTANMADYSPTTNQFFNEFNPTTSTQLGKENLRDFKFSLAQFENDMTQVMHRLPNLGIDDPLPSTWKGASALNTNKVESNPIEAEIKNPNYHLWAEPHDPVKQNKSEQDMGGPQMPDMRGYFFGLEREKGGSPRCSITSGKVPYNTVVRSVEDRCALLDGETGCAKPFGPDIERIAVSRKKPERPADFKPSSQPHPTNAALQSQLYYLNEKPMQQLKKCRKRYHKESAMQ